MLPVSLAVVTHRVELPTKRREGGCRLSINGAEMRALINRRPRAFAHFRTHVAVLLILDTGPRIPEF